MLSVTYRYRIPCLGERSTLIIRLISFNINGLERIVDLFSMYGIVLGVKSKPFKKSVSPERLRCIPNDVIDAVYRDVGAGSELEAQPVTLYNGQFADLMSFSDVRSYMEVE